MDTIIEHIRYNNLLFHYIITSLYQYIIISLTNRITSFQSVIQIKILYEVRLLTSHFNLLSDYLPAVGDPNQDPI